jgi:hypothetical protein
MAQDEQLDIFGEFAAPAPEQQPEHSREGGIGLVLVFRLGEH